MFFKDKIQIYLNEAKKEIVAVGRFAGNWVRAKAKCNPEDDFDYDTGVSLAKARCQHKIAVKRWKHASDRYLKTLAAMNKAQHEHTQATKYFYASVDDMDECAAKVEEIYNQLKEEN